MLPGHRVLIRSANNPAMVACWLAATKAGAVVVNTMPMLRAGELTQIVDKAEIALALCDTRLMDELVACAKESRYPDEGDRVRRHRQPRRRARPRRARTSPCTYEAVRTGRDDVALLGFTSGTTGQPKATMHFHRDLLIIADGYAKEVLAGHAGRRVRRLAAARVHLRARRLGGVPTSIRRGRHAARERVATQHGRHHPDVQGDGVLHRADRLSGDAGGDRRRGRPVVAARCGLGRRNAAGAGLRGMDGQDRQADARRHRRHRDAAHLHLQPARRLQTGMHGHAGARLRGQDRRRRDARGAAQHRRPAGGARPHRMPLPRRRSSAPVRAGRLEPDRRLVRPGRRRLLPLRRPLRRHDHLVGLQHRRTRGRGHAAVTSRMSSSAP